MSKSRVRSSIKIRDNDKKTVLFTVGGKKDRKGDLIFISTWIDVNVPMNEFINTKIYNFILAHYNQALDTSNFCSSCGMT